MTLYTRITQRPFGNGSRSGLLASPVWKRSLFASRRNKPCPVHPPSPVRPSSVRPHLFMTRLGLPSTQPTLHCPFTTLPDSDSRSENYQMVLLGFTSLLPAAKLVVIPLPQVFLSMTEAAYLVMYCSHKKSCRFVLSRSL